VLEDVGMIAGMERVAVTEHRYAGNEICPHYLMRHDHCVTLAA
jgi:hypothetical protein